MFPKVLNGFPNIFPIAPHFVPYALAKVVYVWSEYFYMGEAPKIQNFFLVMGQSRKVMAKNKK